MRLRRELESQPSRGSVSISRRPRSISVLPLASRTNPRASSAATTMRIRPQRVLDRMPFRGTPRTRRSDQGRGPGFPMRAICPMRSLVPGSMVEIHDEHGAVACSNRVSSTHGASTARQAALIAEPTRGADADRKDGPGRRHRFRGRSTARTAGPEATPSRSNSSSPGSGRGRSRRAGGSATFASSASMPTTSWPRLANAAPVMRPTRPVPTVRVLMGPLAAGDFLAIGDCSRVRTIGPSWRRFSSTRPAASEPEARTWCARRCRPGSCGRRRPAFP